MASPNFLKQVIDGKRNMGPESVERFARALQLNDRETSFFRELVAFNQASSAAEKNRQMMEQAARAIEAAGYFRQ